jgi:hypothetical protein
MAISDLGRVRPELHRAVRDTYRDAMHGRHTQREAFDAALHLLLAHTDGATGDDARRLLARLLTQEPQRRGPAPV